MALTATKVPNAPTVKQPDISGNTARNLKKWRILAKNRSVKHTQHVKPVGKEPTQQKDVGNAPVLIYVLKGHDLKIKPTMPPAMNEHQKKQIKLKHSLPANQTQKNLIQKRQIFPRLETYDYMSVRQYVISDPPTIKFRQFIRDTNKIPSVVWQQQMEKAYITTYKTVHNGRPDRYYEMDCAKDLKLNFALYN